MSSHDRVIAPVFQRTDNDCGLCCVAMLLSCSDKLVSVDELRGLADMWDAGTSAWHLVTLCRHFALDAVGVSISRLSPELLPVPSILHWDACHFVVLEQVRRDDAVIVDPSFGHRAIPWDRFWPACGGVAIMVAVPE
jgi:ABC-type bacteriocin/lantibiotic exporter with double-glycine peptidase domain